MLSRSRPANLFIEDEMTTPSSPTVGLTVLYFPANSETTDGRQWPAVVTTVLDSGGSEVLALTVFRPDGSTAARQRVISAATWTTAGSDPGVAHWGYATLNPS